MEIALYAALAVMAVTVVLVCISACRYLGTTNAALIQRLADESAWKSKLLSRLIEIAFRDVIVADALCGGEAPRADAPPDPDPPEQPEPEVVTLDAALERAGEADPSGEANG